MKRKAIQTITDTMKAVKKEGLSDIEWNGFLRADVDSREIVVWGRL
jgi:hypothetical protein